VHQPRKGEVEAAEDDLEDEIEVQGLGNMDQADQKNRCILTTNYLQLNSDNITLPLQTTSLRAGASSLPFSSHSPLCYTVLKKSKELDLYPNFDRTNTTIMGTYPSLRSGSTIVSITKVLYVVVGAF
jgi:hypothetical protein